MRYEVKKYEPSKFKDNKGRYQVQMSINSKHGACVCGYQNPLVAEMRANRLNKIPCYFREWARS